MFKCDYELNGECQLYSTECRALRECHLMDECNHCRYRHLAAEDEPCCRCDALCGKKARKN